MASLILAAVFILQLSLRFFAATVLVILTVLRSLLSSVPLLVSGFVLTVIRSVFFFGRFLLYFLAISWTLGFPIDCTSTIHSDCFLVSREWPLQILDLPQLPPPGILFRWRGPVRFYR